MLKVLLLSILNSHFSSFSIGRIEYYFLVFGGLSILVIEVKYKLRNADERMDAIAQVIAECNGMHYAFPISLFRTHMP